jgi:hypothetical protein
MKKTALFLLVILSFIAYKKAATTQAASASSQRVTDTLASISPQSTAYSNTEK